MIQKRFDVTTIGEGNLRLSAPVGEQLAQAKSLNLTIAGAEGNVAGALSQLGWKSAWLSKLPKTTLAKRVLNEYRLAGIDTSSIVYTTDQRLATLFVDYALPPRSTDVIFDRENSAFSTMTPDEVNWDYLLDTKLIHLTGITAALSDSLREVLNQTVKKAKAAGVKISIDINYREKLWTAEEANQFFMPLVQDADLLFCSQADAEKVFGCSGTNKDKLLKLTKLTNAQMIVMSQSQDGVLAWDGNTVLSNEAAKVEILDRIGAGDALAAGVIHGYLQEDFNKGLQYGCLMAALAMSQFGEMVMVDKGELEHLLNSELRDIVR